MARVSMKQVQSELEAARSMIDYQSQQLILKDEQIARLSNKKRCYQCDKAVNWLASDSRCSVCICITPDEEQGSVPARKPTLSQFCKAYCRENKCRTVPGHVVHEARKKGLFA